MNMRKEIVEAGNKINEWTILHDDGYVNGRRMVYCKCSCGREKQVNYSHLKRGLSKSCGRCETIEVKPGDRYGQWEVLSVTESVPRGTRRYALCRCSCGNEKEIACNKLLSGKTKSCGCWRSDVKNYPERLHIVWKEMIARCYNVNNPKYKDYGSRGIKVCSEWRNERGFAHFADWALIAGYNENAEYGKCTLDRIDVNGDYKPDNCRWVDLKIQGNNKRNNILLEYKGETHTITEWSDKLNIPRHTITNRLRRGYPIEDIFFCGEFDSHRRRKI